MKRWFLVVLACAVFPLSRVATAAPECPDGWFCDDGKGGEERPPESPSLEPRPNDFSPVKPGTPPPAAEPPPPPAPPPERIRLDVKDERHRYRQGRRRREFGLNLHLDVGILGESASADAGMAGLGAAFRFRPLPAFAADVGFDFVGGRDYVGNRRSERAFVGNAVVFFNPRDRLEVYGLAGFALSQAWVRVARRGGYAVPPYNTSYTHYGIQGGLGLEWRLARRAALSTDLVLFRRWRTDRGRGTDPEYVDPESHLATNTSQAALFRLGTTFYF